LNVKPINYQLEFEPNFQNFTFRGKEVVAINIRKPTNIIKLHAAELKIKNCIILCKETLRAKVKLDEKNEQLTILLPKKIVGNAKLSVDFTGILNDRLLGFYKSQYKDKNGNTKYLATTQFEAADARRAFPCWDEPEAKATFDVSIISDRNLVALSNMPVVSKKKTGQKYLYKFAQTPIMSTYLLYLGVGEFEFLSSRLGKTLLRIVTTKGNKSKGRLALDLTKKFLREYEKYFGIKYPLEKLDLLAIPDFASGAMENWGAITFRETILLYDPKSSSTRTKQHIAEVISHELAHQWFGNLVTMRWWNDLWLNESFATFMATKVVDRFYPEWELWDQFLGDAMNDAMGLDALKSSHPIDVKVQKPSEIREIFDSISYDKGGCILRMLEHYVGEKNFQKGLQKYLIQNKYDNATTSDLWDAIESVSKKPVRKMMDSWIRQVGYPVVEIKSTNSYIVVSQKRFLAEPKSKTKERWHIPLTVNTNGKTISKLFSKKSDKITIKDNNILVNSGRHGFYRTRYDNELTYSLRSLIKEKKFNHVDRWAIQNDLYSFSKIGLDKIETYLDFVKAYYDEENYLASVDVAGNLYALYLLTFDKEFAHIIKKHVFDYFAQIFDRLGWDRKVGEKHTDTLLRGFVISILGKLDHESINVEAQKRFELFLRNKQTLDPDLQDAVFSLVAWNGNANVHGRLVSFYRKSKTQEEKLRFLGALCDFKDDKLLQKTLQFALSKEVRSQNIHFPIIRVSGNPYGKKFMWQWMKKNWKKLRKKFGQGNPLANRIVASIALVANRSMEEDIHRFFKRNPLSGTERTLKQTLERIRIRSNFLASIQREFDVNYE